MDSISSAGATRGAPPVARLSLQLIAKPTSEPAVFSLGLGDCRLLQFFHAAGVLHDPGDSGDGALGGWMACARTGSAGGKPRTAGRTDLVDRAAGGRSDDRGDWVWTSDFFKDAGARYRSFRPVEKKSPGLCALIRTLSRPHAAGDGS